MNDALFPALFIVLFSQSDHTSSCLQKKQKKNEANTEVHSILCILSFGQECSPKMVVKKAKNDLLSVKTDALNVCLYKLVKIIWIV